MRPRTAVQLREVGRRFGHRWILRSVSLEVGSGEAVLVVGGNGAGKTTLLRIVAGLLKPTTGVVEREATVGLVAHDTMLYDALTARENLSFFARLHGASDGDRIDDLLRRLGLAEAADRPIVTYSRGMLQRLAIARALLPNPDLLVLDEPLSSLDDPGIRLVVELLDDLRAAGRAIIIATHQIPELVSVAGRVAYLARGRVEATEPIAHGDAEAVRRRLREVIDGG